MRVAAIVLLFLTRLQFHKFKSMSDILCRIYGHISLKGIRKFENLDYRLRKAELDLEFLLRCRDSNVIPKLKLLQEEIRHKNITVLREEFNSSHLSLQHEISFIEFAHVSSLFLRSSNRILASKSATKQKS